MDEVTDNALVELNKRYQKAKKNKLIHYCNSLNRYLGYLQKGDLGQFISDLKYRNYAKKHFTTRNNRRMDDQHKKADVTGKKIAVYTCITGHYDNVTEPLYVEPGVDYLMFTDLELPVGTRWKKVDITKFGNYRELNPLQLNRHIKFFPFLYLPEYDYSIYVDGNIEIVAGMSPLVVDMGDCGLGLHFHYGRDCIYDELVAVLHLKKADPVLSKQQLANYEKDGFPYHYGLYENCVIIRKHNDQNMQKLMQDWWDEYQKYTTRDQFSLPYVIWKTGYDREKIHVIGESMPENPRFNRNVKHLGGQKLDRR